MISPGWRVEIIYYRLCYLTNGMVLPYAGDSGAIIFTMYDIITLFIVYILDIVDVVLYIYYKYIMFDMYLYQYLFWSQLNSSIYKFIHYNLIIYLYKGFKYMNMLPKLLVIIGLIGVVCADMQQPILNGNSVWSSQQQYKIFKQMYVISKLINKNKQDKKNQSQLPTAAQNKQQGVESPENISNSNDCQMREQFLQQQNQKLRQQLQQVKHSYQKMMAKYDNETSWPLLIFLGVAMFVLYHVFGIESGVVRTIVHRFVNNKDNEQCQFTQSSVIKRTTGDWIKLIMDVSIHNKKQCRFKIKKRQSWPINFGIIKTKNENNEQKQQQRIMYGNDCIFYKNSLLKIREGKGFEVGQMIRVVVRPQQNIIRWQVEGQNRYTYFSQSMNLKEGEWRYAIQMRGNTDEVQLID